MAVPCVLQLTEDISTKNVMKETAFQRAHLIIWVLHGLVPPQRLRSLYHMVADGHPTHGLQQEDSRFTCSTSAAPGD